MPKVAIVGSCITRDLWPIRGDGNADLVYVSRTSLASLFAPPVAEFRGGRQPDALRRHQHLAVVGDLEKTALARLVAFAPTHIIFDFIDERFDLLSVGDSRIVRSWELVESGYLNQPALKAARRIPRLSAGCERLWRSGAEEMAAFVRATPLSNAKLILHVSRWATDVRDAKGRRRSLTDVQILEGEPADIAEQNALLAGYEAWFQQVMPPMTRIDVARHRIADAEHQWGLSPFHYVPAYYAEVWRRLEALGVERPSGAPDGPNARAA